MSVSACVRDTYCSLLNLMADTSGSQMVYLQFGKELVPMQLLIVKQWSKVLATAAETAQEGAGRDTRKDKIVIPMDCSKEDWLTVMDFVYPTELHPAITWFNLQVLMEVGDKYNMPALLHMCRSFLLEHKAELDNNTASQSFGWKWIALADKSGLADVAVACFNAKHTDWEFSRSCNKDLVSSLSPDTWQHILVTYAEVQCGPAQAFCGKCGKVTHWRHRKMGTVHSSIICGTCGSSFLPA